jgi:hypothetical protein
MLDDFSNGVLHTRTRDGREFIVRVVQLATPGPTGQTSVSVVLSRLTDHEDWRPISMELRWRSRIALLLTTWPPELVDSIACRDDKLVLRYRDPWVPYFKGSEYEWEATFDARAGKWTLRKLRLLNYDGTDAPPSKP